MCGSRSQSEAGIVLCQLNSPTGWPVAARLTLCKVSRWQIQKLKEKFVPKELESSCETSKCADHHNDSRPLRWKITGKYPAWDMACCFVDLLNQNQWRSEAEWGRYLLGKRIVDLLSRPCLASSPEDRFELYDEKKVEHGFELKR